jgi:hypothetical protein
MGTKNTNYTIAIFAIAPIFIIPEYYNVFINPVNFTFHAAIRDKRSGKTQE